MSNFVWLFMCLLGRENTHSSLAAYLDMQAASLRGARGTPLCKRGRTYARARMPICLRKTIHTCADVHACVRMCCSKLVSVVCRLPNVFRPGEWAPLRRFCTAPKQEEDGNGLLQSTRQFYQPVSWYSVLKALFGTSAPQMLARIWLGQHSRQHRLAC